MIKKNIRAPPLTFIGRLDQPTVTRVSPLDLKCIASSRLYTAALVT